MKKNIKNESTGFTMIEMLLYMALLTVFIGVLVEIFVSIMKSQIQTQTVSKGAIDARFIMQRMFYDFNNSTNLDTTIALFSVDQEGNLLRSGEKLNSLDVDIDNFSAQKNGNSVQITYTIENKDYQTTYNQR